MRTRVYIHTYTYTNMFEGRLKRVDLVLSGRMIRYSYTCGTVLTVPRVDILTGVDGWNKDWEREFVKVSDTCWKRKS